MPELPEAETIVRGLRAASLPERRIADLRIHHDDVLRDEPRAFRGRTKGRTIRDVRRRGKNVVLGLEGGGRIVINLGMTGTLLPDPPADGPEAPTHPAVVFELDRGRLVYQDVRRFGRLAYMDEGAYERWSEGLGPEPLDDTFSADDLAARLTRSRSPVRSWLLDQGRIAGVGNIYANEALHRARVHPARPARSLSGDEARRLHRALRDVLLAALDAGGTTIRDYRNASGEEGVFAGRLRAYGREGEPCPRCDATIQRAVFGSRSAFFCPDCQPESPDQRVD